MVMKRTLKEPRPHLRTRIDFFCNLVLIPPNHVSQRRGRVTRPLRSRTVSFFSLLYKSSQSMLRCCCNHSFSTCWVFFSAVPYSPSRPHLQNGRGNAPPLQYILFLDLPKIDLAGLFVQLQIAIIPGRFDLSILKGLPDRAVRFLSVGTVVKPAFADKGSKIRECILKVLLQYHIHLIRIKGRKSRGIRHIGIFPQPVQLHMPGGMPTAAQFLGRSISALSTASSFSFR